MSAFGNNRLRPYFVWRKDFISSDAISWQDTAAKRKGLIWPQKRFRRTLGLRGCFKLEMWLRTRFFYFMSVNVIFKYFSQIFGVSNMRNESIIIGDGCTEHLLTLHANWIYCGCTEVWFLRSVLWLFLKLVFLLSFSICFEVFRNIYRFERWFVDSLRDLIHITWPK